MFVFDYEVYAFKLASSILLALASEISAVLLNHNDLLFRPSTKGYSSWTTAQAKQQPRLGVVRFYCLSLLSQTKHYLSLACYLTAFPYLAKQNITYL